VFNLGIIKKLFSFFFNKKKSRISLFIDGPNLLRKEFDLDLNKIRNSVSEFGDVRESKVFLNQFAPDKLIEAIANEGFEPVIGVGDKKDDQASDVDVYVAVSAMHAIYNPHIDIIALATRDADFLPVIRFAKIMGKKTIVIGQDPGFSKALQHIADDVIILDGLHKNNRNKKNYKSNFNSNNIKK
jgi:uncharacterized protein (TIGR00288 family)